MSAGTHVIEVPGGTVRVEPGALGEVPRVVETVAPAHRPAVVTDETVAALHLPTLLGGFEEPPVTIVIPPGEGEKNRDQWAAITDQLLAAGFGRDTVIVALGGGVIGDLAGFVAATYMRGVPCIQVPTTLLAMVDASVGGKTAVDVPAGKNLVGAFHPPGAVVVDPMVLATLPLRELRAGVAEMLKHGAIADVKHLRAVCAAAGAWSHGDSATRRDSITPFTSHSDDTFAHLTRLIADSIAIKASVVREDPTERGRRRTLNFGHTVAHAVEAASGFALLHGEAVAIGMALEARLAEAVGIAESGTAAALEQAIRSCGLPTCLPPSLTAASLLPWMARDKKNLAAEPAFALPRRLGEMEPAGGRWSVTVPVKTIQEVLAAASPSAAD